MPANIGNNNLFISKGNMTIQTAPSSLPSLAHSSETLEESVTALNQVLGLDPENANDHYKRWLDMHVSSTFDNSLHEIGDILTRTLSSRSRSHPQPTLRSGGLGV
jgi:thiaminase